AGIDNAAIVVSVGIFRIELDSARVVGNGAVEVALNAICGTAVVVGHSIFGIELDRLRIIGDGAVEVALEAICDAAVGVGGRILRTKVDPLGVVGEGGVEVVFGFIWEAAVEVGARQVFLIFATRLNNLRAAGNRLIVGAVVSVAPGSGLRLLRRRG